MQDDVQKIVAAAIEGHADSGPGDLTALAKRLAVWATENTINDDGSRLRERGYALAGALVDWERELYPDNN